MVIIGRTRCVRPISVVVLKGMLEYNGSDTICLQPERAAKEG